MNDNTGKHVQGRQKPVRPKPTASGAAHRLGNDPEQDAWFTAFYIENHLDYFTHSEQAAPPEQVRFMVYLDEDERYYPCSKRMFDAIMSRKKSRFMAGKYTEALERVMALIEDQIEDASERRFLESLIRIKYNHEIRDQIMIPSRLEKRLVTIFLKRTLIEDPYLHEKVDRNRRMHQVMNSTAFQEAMNHVGVAQFEKAPKTLAGVREMADYLELTRLLALIGAKSLWTSDESATYSAHDYLELFHRPIVGSGVDHLLKFLEITGNPAANSGARGKRILWLANEAGEVLLDLAIIRFLNKLGHKVILSFKEGPLFTKVDFTDADADEVLHRELEGALLITEKSLSKNDLVSRLRSDHKLLVISDGTRENLNLLLASTTFARMFKEVDGVITRGDDLKRRLFDTPFQFTQDIYDISADTRGSVEIAFKQRHPAVIKFSHADLEKKARAIIEQMAVARSKGMTVVFYSGIIGSIPGKTRIAKEIMTVFIQQLREHSAQTFFINPSEYFEPGMDADDLMYMWEIVQRSGYIDIWRFQTFDDIVTAFGVLNRKVPPEWFGKDATFSTGCTKEMKIAVDVQRRHPEMQIIGPSQEKFLRREEYGIGKMYDRRLGGSRPNEFVR
jgi:hypothetical protein